MDLALSFILIFIAVIVTYFGYMLPFMGVIFLAFASLKLADIKGFVNIFKSYDLLAKKHPKYGYIYPFIELFVAICFLTKLLIIPAAIVTLIIMTTGAISISLHLRTKKRKACACLGAKFRIPLTRFTLVEDIIMALMALKILI